ncbi:ORF6N domain-containing protein [Peredibacter sp. HCB2-198]|uniref:ORF6N domain-containing protein n=1 Tax=Peredibacter sp. HCB2-198 TaxID=3383025 RepID=UPI0038B4944B
MDKNQIEKKIYIIRGQKVMLDSDLAELYEIQTKDLTRQVKRNISRFPDDFLIRPNSKDLENWRCQIGAANDITNWNHMRKSTPILFTENGIAHWKFSCNGKRKL